MTDGQKCDFIIKFYKTFHNDFTGTGTTALLSILPCGVDLVGTFDRTLTMTGRTHNRFDHAGNSNFGNCPVELFAGGGETVGAGRQPQFFSGQSTDAFAVHGKQCSIGGGDHAEPLFFQFDQRGSGDRFHFGNDIIGLFGLNNAAEFRSVEHIDHIRTVSHLHTGGIRITINGNDFNTEPLHGDHNFFAQLPCSAEKDLGSRSGQGCSDFYTHGKLLHFVLINRLFKYTSLFPCCQGIFQKFIVLPPQNADFIGFSSKKNCFLHVFGVSYIYV